MATAFGAHLAGDENKALEDSAWIGQTGRHYGASSWLRTNFCDPLWTDKIPKDNSLTIQLKSDISFK